MIASCYRPPTVSNQSGVSCDAFDAHTNLTTFSRPVSSTQATSILGYHSRFLPRVSPQALTLTQLDTLELGVLGGVSGLRMLHGLNRTSTKNARVRSVKLKQDKIIEWADISTHNRRRRFLQGAAYWCAFNDLRPDDQSQPVSEGLARKG